MSGFFDHRVTGIDGTPDLLGPLRDHVLLAVNVASRCGYTPQYAGLERLQKELADERFTIIGFPCNQFGAQEPGTEQQIREFCSTRFGVSFPLSTTGRCRNRWSVMIAMASSTDVSGCTTTIRVVMISCTCVVLEVRPASAMPRR